MLDWDDLRFFLDAVRAGNYTEAAKRLKVNRTTVGRRLAQLEQRVGASLFEQTGTGYRPTARGRIVLEKARAMEQAVDEMIAALQVQASAHSGLIRVASSAEIGLEFMAEFADFPALHPGVRIEFLALPDAFNALVERKADLALCVALVVAYRRPHRCGQILAAYIGAYSVYRFGIEAIRKGVTADVAAFGLTGAQLFSVVCVVLAAAWWLALQRRGAPAPALVPITRTGNPKPEPSTP